MILHACFTQRNGLLERLVLRKTFGQLQFTHDPPRMDHEAFEILAQSKPADIDRLDELTTFFEHTDLGGRRQRGEVTNTVQRCFPLIFGIAGDGIARATNSVEGWHHSLLSFSCCFSCFLASTDCNNNNHPARNMDSSTCALLKLLPHSDVLKSQVLRNLNMVDLMADLPHS
jgi:hypothetical protein